ncbi:MAG: alpha-2-macroglobulin [Vicinamibacterales bacterium]
MKPSTARRSSLHGRLMDSAGSGSGIIRCLLVLIVLCGTSELARAQRQPTATASFSLSSSRIFTTQDEPHFYATFQNLDHLDFRVYKVQDIEAFFRNLPDPHMVGSPEPVVAQEPTLVERLATWKAERRAKLQSMLRTQFSPAFRRARSTARDRARLVERRTVRNFTQFARVPLLNSKQVVASWREVLPRTRDQESRRIPLDLASSGVYLVEAVQDRQRAFAIVVVSDLALLTKTAPGQLLAWTVQRTTGEPRVDCSLTPLAAGQPLGPYAPSADGVLTASLERTETDNLVTIAHCGSDFAVADPGGYFLQNPERELVGYVYPDRPVYRPGQTVHIKTILRWRERGLIRPFDRAQVEVSLVDSADTVVHRMSRPVDEFGAVSVDWTVSTAAALGVYSIRVVSEDAETSGSFEVQEYRKPEFEVSVSPQAPIVLQGQQLRVSFAARYYFGQPVSGGRVRWVVQTGSYYSPYRWVDASDADVNTQPVFYGGDQVSEARTTLNQAGEADVSFAIPASSDRGDLTVRVEAHVSDASGREVSGQTTVIAPRARLLVALASDRYLYRPGENAVVRARVVDYRGMPAGRMAVRFALEKLSYPDGRYDAPTIDVVTDGSATSDDSGRSEWRVQVPASAGDYRVRAEIAVDGRAAEGTVSIYLPDPESTFYDEGDRTLELIADRSTYAPGETARFVVRGEPLDAPILVTKEHARTTWHQVVRPAAGAMIDVPIDEDDVGDVWVNVAFVRNDRLYRAERRLRVPAVSRTLKLDVNAAQPVARPREPGMFTLRVTDQSGAPVRAQVSVAIVDEALYGVKPDLTPDPVRFFHQRGYSQVGTQFSRDYGFVGYSGSEPLQLAQRRRPFTLADFKAERPERAAVRKDFPDAIYWSPTVTTDANGLATVKVAYPDALTTWRLTARAITTDTRAAAAVARTTVTKDLILRLAHPRFLTEGDQMQLPVVVHNYHDASRPVQVTVSAAGLEPPASSSGPRRLDVASDSERMGLWEYRANRAGTAELSGTATTTDDEDRLSASLPVLPYGLMRESGVSGSTRTTSPVDVSLDVPATSNAAGRTITVTLSPTLAGTLLGALDFLTTYPYGCTEQVLSSFLPNLLVLRSLNELKLAPVERMSSLDRMSGQGLRRLLEYQHEDGGWGWWAADRNHPFMTAYALYGLLEASRLGLPVDDQVLRRAARATAQLYAEYPRAVPELKAYLTWVLEMAATRDLIARQGDEAWESHSVVDQLWAQREQMSAYGRALLLLVLEARRDARAEALAESLVNDATTTGDLAWWTSDRDPLLGDQVDTSVEATALALQALAARMPDHPTIDRAVRWLMANRVGGAYWGSTKQTAMALYGLLAVMTARGEQPSTFDVDVFVNEQRVTTERFTPDDWTAAQPARVSVPARAGRNDVRLTIAGTGSVYWTATARYYDVREPIEREGTRTLALKREYFALTPVTTAAGMVYRTQALPEQVRPGDLILVRLTAAGSKDWRFLVVDDPIPAGTEPVLEPESINLERPTSWWTGSRREYRDDRVVQFQEGFGEGRYEYHYLLKAVTPGRFRARPAQIQPMYVPGISASTVVHTLAIGAPDGAAAGAR